MLQDASVAPSLPNMFPSLLTRQVAIRRGEVNLIAGQPASGKSTLAMALAVRAKVPTLYVSADTHAHTMSMRLIAMLTGATQDQVEAAMESDRTWAAEILERADYLTWSFDSAPSVQTVEDELLAHIELNGVPPMLTVIDNLTDMMGNVVREGTGTQAALQGLDVAGKTGTAETGANGLNDAWFVGFAPKDDPKVAVAVVVERTPETGGVAAAPIAREVMKAAIARSAG